MPKNSEARIKANGRYTVKTYETVSTRAKRTDRVNELVDIGAARAGESKAAYILNSILDRLQRDGITAADLPPLPDETTEP